MMCDDFLILLLMKNIVDMEIREIEQIVFNKALTNFSDLDDQLKVQLVVSLKRVVRYNDKIAQCVKEIDNTVEMQEQLIRHQINKLRLPCQIGLVELACNSLGYIFEHDSFEFIIDDNNDLQYFKLIKLLQEEKRN